MKTIFLLFLIPLVAFGQQVIQTADIRIINNDNYPKLEVTSTDLSAQTNPWLVIGTQTNVVFQIPASGIIAAQYLGINSNSVLPLASGGTGGSNALSARISLGLGSGLTTNFNVIFGSALTNTLQFSNGVLTNITAVP